MKRMKRIFSEVQRERIFKSQLSLLSQDLKDCSILLKNKSYRSAYIFLFDALERVLDIFFISKGEKPTNRREREEMIFKYFSPETYRKFRSFYYERRGGMYEDFFLVSKRDFSQLFKFFVRVLSEVKRRVKVKVDGKIENLLENLKKLV